MAELFPPSRFGSARRRPLLTHQVARRLRLSPRTVRHLAQIGKLPAYMNGPKIWLYRPLDVEAYKARRERLGE